MAQYFNVLSPCVGVCQVDPETGHCIGCQRTVDEIMAWPKATDGERQAILDRVEARRDDDPTAYAAHRDRKKDGNRRRDDDRRSAGRTGCRPVDRGGTDRQSLPVYPDDR